MQELDRWTQATIIKPLFKAHEYMCQYEDPVRYNATVIEVEKAIRRKLWRATAMA